MDSFLAVHPLLQHLKFQNRDLVIVDVMINLLGPRLKSIACNLNVVLYTAAECVLGLFLNYTLFEIFSIKIIYSLGPLTTYRAYQRNGVW